MAQINKQDVVDSTLQIHGAGEYVSKTYAMSVIEQLQATNQQLVETLDALSIWCTDHLPEHLYNEAEPLIEGAWKLSKTKAITNAKQQEKGDE